MVEIVKVKRIKGSRGFDIQAAKLELPKKWDYATSVKFVKFRIYKWGKLTTEILVELRIAREMLSRVGNPNFQPKNAIETNVPIGKSWDTYCVEIGSCRRTVNRWLALWLSGGSLVGKLTGNVENYTRTEEIEMVRSVLGEIDLDPASCKFAQKVIKAKKYYTEKTNGLDKPWHGKVFLNPPYGMPLIRHFTDKLIEQLPNIDAAILLTNDQTDTAWWQKCAKESDLICMPSGRISFYTPDKEKTSPTNGQTFFYYGDNENKFGKVFSKKGLIVKVIQ